MFQFSDRSLTFLRNVHPDLVAVAFDAIKRIDFSVICGQRGRAAQMDAFKNGKSRATFGASPHNYAPALAVDVLPYPFNGDWNDPALVPRLQTIYSEFEQSAAKLKIEDGVSWGGNFKSIKDFDHIELTAWREIAKASKLAE